jgi:DNA repair protein RecO (recombination protein O)
MSTRHTSEPAFVLHTRPYRNTSLLVDLFTEKHGRLRGIARSARGLRSRYKNIFRPFAPLVIGWTGRQSLRHISHAEPGTTSSYLFSGNILYCGLYVNELLYKLLPLEEPFTQLFSQYHTLLNQLASSCNHYEIYLRYFEKHLLQETGYGLSLTEEIHNQQAIQANQYYAYRPKQGFYASKTNKLRFSGECLLALAEENLTDNNHMRQAKQLMRIAIDDALDHRMIVSKHLFV